MSLSKLERARKKEELRQRVQEQRQKEKELRRNGITVGVIILILFSLVTAYFLFDHFSKPSGEERWTLAIYMSGDNSLSDYTQTTLDQIDVVGYSDNVNVVILCDKDGSNDTSLLTVSESGISELPLSTMDEGWDDELNLADYMVLHKFITWVLEENPEDKVFFSMWSHGENWESFCVDKRTNMHLHQFRLAMKDIPRKVDIIGFDSCGMASIEVMCEVEPYADYLIASEKKEPKSGWPYGDLMHRMMDGDSARDVVKVLPSDYTKMYTSTSADAESFSLQLTGVDLAYTEKIVQEFKGFINHFQNLTKADVSTGRDGVLVFEDRDFVDLMDMVEKMGYDVSIPSLGRAIISNAIWSNPDSPTDVGDACGICVYYPQDEIDREYEKTTFDQETDWSVLLIE